MIPNVDNGINFMFSLLLTSLSVPTREQRLTAIVFLFNYKKDPINISRRKEKNHYDNIYSTIICWNYISFRIHLSYWFITREDTTERNDFLYFILLLKYIQKCTINTPIHVSVIVYKNPLKSLFILSQIVSFETPIKIYELN